MKETMKRVSSGLMIAALMISALNLPMVSVAQAQSVADSSVALPGFEVFDNIGAFVTNVVSTANNSAVTCQITANTNQVFVGGSVTLSWNTPNATTITINGQPVSGTSGSIVMNDIRSNTTYTIAASGGGSSCTASVTIICLPVPVDCRLEITKSVDRATAVVNDILTYTIRVRNVGTTDCTGSGVKIQDVLSERLTYLSNTTSANITPGYDGGVPVYNASTRLVHFNGNVLNPGEEGTMTIAARVTAPATCGDFVIPNQARTTAFELNNFGSWVNSNTVNTAIDNDCPIVVDPAPTCDSFSASPATIQLGSSATLNWQTSNATRVTLNNGIGDVAVDGSRVVSPTTNTTYTLTVFGTQNRSVTCDAPVVVTTTPPPTLSCANNVSFTASQTSIRRGDQVTLNWSSNNIDSLLISVIGSTALSGSTTVEPASDTTYVLTARKGTQSVDCPLTIRVEESRGGGGGGSSSPRCELTISDNRIKSGERVTLKWDTSRATKVVLKDSQGRTLMSTDKFDKEDRKDYYDGSIDVRPTRDMEYTLVASRGSKDRTCKVKVNVDDIKVITDRDQQPLVSGISLSNVPHTGFEAGPFLTVVFYTLLAAWALFLSYLIISRRQPVADFMKVTDVPLDSMSRAEAARPDVFVPSITASQSTVASAPVNLPTAPVVGYENLAVSVNPHQVTDQVIATLENRAHEQMALLSSDAIRHFIATTEGMLERNEALDVVIATAKQQYPLEDGWIVINEARMRDLCIACTAAKTTEPHFAPSVVPQGSSSLAEAIVTGNVVAAYEMIGARPMFALADAAADFDNVVRSRRGENVKISALLATEAAKLSEEKIKNIIAALTGALDGTYTDEASAVKMAIMKAVKEVA